LEADLPEQRTSLMAVASATVFNRCEYLPHDAIK